MIKELNQAVKFKTFHGIHFKDLSYKEKFLPSGEFDKSKSRLLAGGHMQVDEYSGESSAPTARLDTMSDTIGRRPKEEDVKAFTSSTSATLSDVATFLTSMSPKVTW